MKEYEAIRDFKYSPNGVIVKDVKKGETVTLDDKRGKKYQKCAFIKSLGRDEDQGGDNENTETDSDLNKEKDKNKKDSSASGATTMEDKSWDELELPELTKYALEKHGLEIDGSMKKDDIQMMILEKENE